MIILGQTAILLYCPYCNGHQFGAYEKNHAKRDLRFYYGTVSLLQGKQTGLAEQYSSQSLAK